MEISILTEAQLIAINEKFSLDLDYQIASHYRAAQVIWSLSKAKGLNLAADPAGDTPAPVPALEGTASSYPGTSADTAD